MSLMLLIRQFLIAGSFFVSLKITSGSGIVEPEYIWFEVFRPSLLYPTTSSKEFQVPISFKSLNIPNDRDLFPIRYGFNEPQARQPPFFSFFPRRRFTTISLTETYTSTIKTTCTLSTTACSGRRRRSPIKDVFVNQFENISIIAPSATQPIEATLLDLSDSISRHSEERDGRSRVDFGSLYWPTPSEFWNEVQSSRKSVDEDPTDFYSSPTARMNFDNSFRSALAQLVYGIEDDIPTLIPAADVLPRQLFSSFFSRRSIYTRTFISWVTTFSVSTVTSTPGCSVAGELNQCPSG